MNWRRSMWRAYGVLAPIVIATRITRLPLGRRTLGEILGRLAHRSLPLDPSKPAEVWGHKMYLHPRDILTIPGFISGRYEASTRVVFEKAVKPGMTVVDAGAHVGIYTLLAARLLGCEGRVYAFEPEPSNFALLLKNIAANEYEHIVRPVPKALSDLVGSTILYLGERDSIEASFYQTVGTGNTSVVVETTTLDDFFEGEGWPSVHLIKMDIEGAEVAALNGARKLIQRNPNLKLIIEFSPGTITAAGLRPEELLDLLQDLGFAKIFALQKRPIPIQIPEDSQRLVKVAGDGFVNLLCER